MRIARPARDESLQPHDIGYRATKFLIDLGHREIVHITGILSHQDAIRRFEGYQHALEEAGIPKDPDLVFEGGFDAPSGVEAIETMIAKKKKFTAVFAANDMSAYGVRLAFFRHGIHVPHDVSLIGVDDQLESAFMTPPLTTVRQPAFEMGTIVATAMLDILARKEYSFTRPPIEIIVRESTAPLE